MLVFVVPYFIYIVFIFIFKKNLNYFNYIHIKMMVTLYFTGSLLHILHVLTIVTTVNYA